MDFSDTGASFLGLHVKNCILFCCVSR